MNPHFNVATADGTGPRAQPLGVERWVDAAIGETREVLLRNGVPFALHVSRWSDNGRRALWGETYSGRVRTIDRRRRGAFVDIGLGDVHAFLRLDARGGSEALIWLLDGKQIGRSRIGKPLEVALGEAGRHTITVLDESGRYDSVAISVR